MSGANIDWSARDESSRVFDMDRIQRQIERIVFDKLKEHPELGNLMSDELEIEIHGKPYPCTTVQFENSITPKT